MIYEGHEAETRTDFEQHINELKETVDFSVVGFRYYVDGDSDRRPIAILKRVNSHSTVEHKL